MIGSPIAIQIPRNLTQYQAQLLVTEFINGDDTSQKEYNWRAGITHVPFHATARGSSAVVLKKYENWQIEQWEPGSMVAAYSWKTHLLRVKFRFDNRNTILEIGESENLRQSPTRIHKAAKALVKELGRDIQFAYGKVASSQRQFEDDAFAQGTKPNKPSYCGSIWEGEPQEQASCQRAQRRSYDHLRPLISQLKVSPSSLESRRLRACSSVAQTRAGIDWEATERCFYSPPASLRY
jgi:hypothetical protein